MRYIFILLSWQCSIDDVSILNQLNYKHSRFRNLDRPAPLNVCTWTTPRTLGSIILFSQAFWWPAVSCLCLIWTAARKILCFQWRPTDSFIDLSWLYYYVNTPVPLTTQDTISRQSHVHRREVVLFMSWISGRTTSWFWMTRHLLAIILS